MKPVLNSSLELRSTTHHESLLNANSHHRLPVAYMPVDLRNRAKHCRIKTDEYSRSKGDFTSSTCSELKPKLTIFKAPQAGKKKSISEGNLKKSSSQKHYSSTIVVKLGSKSKGNASTRANSNTNKRSLTVKSLQRLRADLQTHNPE